MSYTQIINKFDIVIGLHGVKLRDKYQLVPILVHCFYPLFAQCTATVDPFPLPPLGNSLSYMTTQYKVELVNDY